MGISTTPAGWYPQADGQQRYWDGETWTEHFAPGVAAVVPPKKPWFKRKRIIIPSLVLLILVGLGAIGSTQNTSTTNASSTSAADQAAAGQKAIVQAQTEKATADKAGAEATYLEAMHPLISNVDDAALVSLAHSVCDAFTRGGTYAEMHALTIKSYNVPVTDELMRASVMAYCPPYVNTVEVGQAAGAAQAAAADKKASVKKAAADGAAAAKAAAAKKIADANRLTIAQENAKRSAESYISMSGFSRSGLIGQLKYEGFSAKDASRAIDRIEVNWNTEADQSAKSYVDMTGFSRSGLIQQLEFEGYTRAQAIHGANSVGL